jgi:hypothetical protein
MVTMFRHFIRNSTIVEQEATHGFVTPNWWVYPPYSLCGVILLLALFFLYIFFGQDLQGRGRVVR